MGDVTDVEIEGWTDELLDEVNDKLYGIVRDTADFVLEQSLEKVPHGATSNLANSGEVSDVDDLTQEVIYGAMYASFVEWGRASGKMPPVGDSRTPGTIAHWVWRKREKLNKKAENDPDKKVIETREHAKSVGFAVAQKISETGTQPSPFLEPAVQEGKEYFRKRLREEGFEVR